MIKTIFCLSMPGAHMSYLGVLTKILLGHVPVNKNYITDSGSSHNAQTYFPPQNFYNFTKDWDNWLKKSIEDYTHNNVCVFKDGWGNTDLDVWEHNINSLPNSLSIVSHPTTKIDYYYSWLNYSSKMPISLYGQLKTKNSLFPIWHMLKNKHKLAALYTAMPVFPTKVNLNFKIGHIIFPTTTMISDSFPITIHNFLLQHNLQSIMTDEILNFHKFFTSKQIENYELAVNLANNKKWEPRNVFDKILFKWIDTNPWAELE